MRQLVKTMSRLTIFALMGAGLLFGGMHAASLCGYYDFADSVLTQHVFEDLDAQPTDSLNQTRPSKQPSSYFAQFPDSRDYNRGVARYPGDEGKNHTKIKEVFTTIVAPVKGSVVRVICDNKEVALGSVVSKEGLILTKASELTGIIYCQFADGKKLSVVVLGVSQENDLALLKVKSTNLVPVVWRENDVPTVGSFLTTVGLSNEPIAFGVMSVSPRKINTPSGVLGVRLAQDKSGPRIDNVVLGSAAEKAGLKTNDVVMKINDQNVATSQAMIELVAAFRPGDKLQLLVQRGDAQINLAATLGRQESAYFSNSRRPRGTDARLAGELSERRGGFPKAIQHDTVLHPAQCGGPLLDLDSKTVGINIARADRVSTYAIPASVVLEVLADLESGNLTPSPELRGNNKDRFAIKLKQYEVSAKDATALKKDVIEKLNEAKNPLPETATDAEKTKAKEKITALETKLKSAGEREKKTLDTLKSAKETMKKLTAEN